MPVPTEVPAELLNGPFTLTQAVALGVSRKVLLGRRFRRLYRGVYVPATLPDSLGLRVDAARLLLPPAAAFSHHTAAALRRLPIAAADSPIHATVPPETARRRLEGLVLHRCPLGGSVVRLGGRQVTSPERNFLELARHLSLVDLVILGDAMVRRGWTTVSALRNAVASMPRWPGVAAARRAAELVRSRVDSPMETRSRLLLVLAGLPCPEPGMDVYGEVGQWVARPDLQYRDQRLALEYDGDLHRTLKRKWRQDVTTREMLRDLGWEVLALTADDIYARPEELLERVRRKLVERGHPDVPQDLDPAWQRHFTVRRSWSDGW